MKFCVFEVAILVISGGRERGHILMGTGGYISYGEVSSFSIITFSDLKQIKGFK